MIKYLIIFLAFSLTACETHVFFADSLPPGVPDSPAIPEAFVGVYQSKGSNSFIYIEDSLIYSRMTEYVGKSIDMMFAESACSGVEEDDFLSGRTCFPYTDQSDSVQNSFSAVDTLFSLCSGATANVLDGDLFLNYQNQHGEYLTAIVSFGEEDQLVWSLLKIPADEKKIKKLTDRYSIVNDRCKHDVFVLDPTLRQFEDILASEYLVAQDSLMPMESN